MVPEPHGPAGVIVPTPSTARGIAVATLKAQALQQPVGNQAAYFLNGLATAIGAGAKVKIIVGGTVKYQDNISGSLTVTSNYIQVPAAFNEPPEVSAADAMTGSAVLEIEHATNAGVALVVPIALSVDTPADAKIDISGPLIAGVAVKTNNLRIMAPPELDVPVIGGSNYPPPPTSGTSFIIRTVNDEPFVVPETLMGGQFHLRPQSWPGDPTWNQVGGSGAANGPTTQFIKSLGSHAVTGASWAGIENVGWGAMDAAMEWARSLGAMVNFTNFQTPNKFAMSGYSANRNFFPGLNGGSGNDKGNVPPVPGAMKDFVRRLLQRYSDLTLVESWNEYEEVPLGFWQGDHLQMARVMRECNEARIEVRPSVKILWPGMVNWEFSSPETPFSNWTKLASASDGAGGQARDHIQGIGHHLYFGSSVTTLQMAIYLRKVQVGMNQMGKGSLPKYMTEGGFTDGARVASSTAARTYGRLYAICAAFGYQCVNPWSMDIGPERNGSVWGNWGANNPSLNADFLSRHAEVKNALVGKVVRWAYVMSDGTLRIGLGDGTTFSI